MEFKLKLKNKLKLKKRKGFIFTLLALLIVAFMIIEMNIYFGAFRVRQETEPAKVRAMVLEEVAGQLTPYSIGKISEIAAYDALYALTKDAVGEPVAKVNLSDVIWSLMWNGTRSDTGSKLADATISAWTEKLENLTDRMGFNVSVNYSNPVVSQSDPWTVQVNYTFNYTLKDDYSKTEIKDMFNISVDVYIVGFEDPLFKNETTYERNILPIPTDYDNPWIDEIYKNASDIGKGRGWFYGKIYNNTKIASAGDIEIDWRNKLEILYTSDIDIATDYGDMFGGVIVSDTDLSIRLPDYSRIQVPFVADSLIDIDLSEVPAVLIYNEDDIDYSVGNHSVYDMEHIRKMALCGLYYNNTDAPSFLDRLSHNKTAQDPMGIETMIVGNWIPPTKFGKSVIDHKYFADSSGDKIMGMPGCKFVDMCNDTVSPKFTIDSTHTPIYGLDDLICTGGRCG